jgi:hypothetical protein
MKHFKSWPRNLFFIVALFVCAIEGRAQNLVVNGSFETPDVTNATKAQFPTSLLPWQTTATNFEIWTNGWDNPAAGIGKQYSIDGGQNLEILSSGSSDTVWQTVPTVSGEHYRFSFYYTPRPKTSPDVFVVSVNSNAVLSVVDDGSALTNFNWQLFETNLVAGSNLTTLAFSDLSPGGGGSGTHIDGVILEHEPWLVMEMAGTNINIHWVGVSNEIYQLQFRTNLITGNWSNLGAVVSGNDTTNSSLVTPTNAPQIFYRVVVGP